jgi:hypothetical protein
MNVPFGLSCPLWPLPLAFPRGFLKFRGVNALNWAQTLMRQRVTCPVALGLRNGYHRLTLKTHRGKEKIIACLNPGGYEGRTEKVKVADCGD